jgi:uncharacterized protein (UPF0332 family)
MKRPDIKRSLSLLESARVDFHFTLSLNLNKKSSNTIVRNIYESFRMLGEALLIAKGLEPKDHIMPINELIKLKINIPRPLNVLDNFRRLRHNINYYGYKTTIEEAQDMIDFAELSFEPLFEEIKKQIEQMKSL